MARRPEPPGASHAARSSTRVASRRWGKSVLATYTCVVPNSTVIGQALQLVPDAPDLAPVPARGPTSATALALDWLHRDTASAFLTETSPELSTLATDAASALGLGTDRERADARIRLAARMVAVGRVQEQTLELALAAALDRRDDAGIVMLNRVLDGVSKRTHRWLEEHRLSCSAGQRSVAVAVNAVGNVTINGER